MKYIYGSIIGGALVYGFLFTFDMVKGNTDSVYVTRPCNCERCEICYPPTKCTTVKIEGGKIYPDCELQFQLIKVREAQIEDLKSKNTCYKNKCSGFADVGCN